MQTRQTRFPIVEETKVLVKKENIISVAIIRNLQSIYDQRIHLEMGYPSLFKFCTSELGMCGANAQRKCDALKISQFIPDLPGKIETGEITLSRVTEVSKFLRHEKKETGRVFESKEVGRLMTEAQAKSNDFEARRFLMTQSETEVAPITDQKRVVSGGRTVLEFEVDDEFLALLEQTKDLHSHKGPRKLKEVLKDVLKDHLKHKHPAYKGLSKRGVKPQTELGLNAPSLSNESKLTRHIPTHIKQKVWKRDQGKCTFQDQHTKKCCGSTFRIQYEHLIPFFNGPFSLGGKHTENNLTLRCQSHNLMGAEKMGLLSGKNFKEQEICTG